MLRLYPSNKTEHLAVVISEVMKASPLSSSFSNEVILIQSHGMGTWLQQEISQNLATLSQRLRGLERKDIS